MNNPLPPPPKKIFTVRQAKREIILPKRKYGRVAMKSELSYHNETILELSDELENKIGYLYARSSQT